jgi:hypothetical protein
MLGGSAASPVSPAQAGAPDGHFPVNKIARQMIVPSVAMVLPAFAADKSAITAVGAFTKDSPTNGATGQSVTPVLTWSSSDGATSYQYCYDTSGNSSCDTGWQVTSNISVELGTLISSTTYYWQVLASDGVITVEADSGAWYSFTTESSIPAAPSNLSQTGAAMDYVILSWQDHSNNESGFKIYRWNGFIFAYKATVAANVTSFADNGLPCDGIYAYNVTSFNDNGESPHSPWINASTTACLYCYLSVVSN